VISSDVRRKSGLSIICCFDVVQAFLNSDVDPDNPAHIFLPPRWKEHCEARGLEHDPTDLIQLGKSQHGQVDAAKRWMDMFVTMLAEPGGCELLQSKVDPCALHKLDQDGKLLMLVLLHVDDGCACGKPSEIKKMKTHLQSKVEALEIGRMKTHLGVDCMLKKDEIGWHCECNVEKHIKEAVADFEEAASTTVPDFRTPGAPNTALMKLPEDEEPINVSGFRKHVGKLLCAVMKVSPDCANAIRDPTCHLSRPGEEHWKALHRLMGCLKHRHRPFKLRAPSELRVIDK